MGKDQSTHSLAEYCHRGLRRSEMQWRWPLVSCSFNHVWRTWPNQNRLHWFRQHRSEIHRWLLSDRQAIHRSAGTGHRLHSIRSEKSTRSTPMLFLSARRFLARKTKMKGSGQPKQFESFETKSSTETWRFNSSNQKQAQTSGQIIEKHRSRWETFSF